MRPAYHLALIINKNKKMKTPKTLLIRNDRTLSKGYVTLPHAALKDAHDKEKPVVAYIRANAYSNLPVTAILWKNQKTLKDAFIDSEWIPHEANYSGFMKSKSDGYWLTRMKATREDIVTFEKLPKYAQNGIEMHQKRTGGKR